MHHNRPMSGLNSAATTNLPHTQYIMNYQQDRQGRTVEDKFRQAQMMEDKKKGYKVSPQPRKNLCNPGLKVIP